MRSGSRYQARSEASRRGFTLVEVVVIMTILGVIAAFLMPTLRKTFSANARHTARRETVASLYRAQATAVQYSRRSWLIRSGNTLKVIVDSSGSYIQKGALLDVNKAFGATLVAAPTDSIAFDPRGFAIVTGTTPKLILTVSSSSGADTVCVTGLSRIAIKACP
jgi:prepilin-type N-terminal cleavage/methylation domain-containing protein